jgi:hypothetical protein
MHHDKAASQFDAHIAGGERTQEVLLGDAAQVRRVDRLELLAELLHLIHHLQVKTTNVELIAVHRHRPNTKRSGTKCYLQGSQRVGDHLHRDLRQWVRGRKDLQAVQRNPSRPHLFHVTTVTLHMEWEQGHTSTPDQTDSSLLHKQQANPYLSRMVLVFSTLRTTTAPPSFSSSGECWSKSAASIEAYRG